MIHGGDIGTQSTIRESSGNLVFFLFLKKYTWSHYGQEIFCWRIILREIRLEAEPEAGQTHESTCGITLWKNGWDMQFQ